MSFSSLQNPSRRAFFRLFALSSLAFASVTLLPGCGGKNSGKEEAFEEQNVKAARTQIGLFAKALNGYYLDNKTYPSRLQGLMENVDQAENWKGPYLESIPLDPWGMEYQYVCPGKHNPDGFDLRSFGADKKEGGEGSNADIAQWTIQ